MTSILRGTLAALAFTSTVCLAAISAAADDVVGGNADKGSGAYRIPLLTRSGR